MVDANEFKTVTFVARRSLAPAIVLASSKEPSVTFVRAWLAGLSRADTTVLLIDVPDEPTGKSQTGLDDLLRRIVSSWEAEIFIGSASGNLKPMSLSQVLVQRGFDLVVVAPKTWLRTYRVAAGLKTFIKIVQPRTSDCGPERELELNHANPLSNKCWTKPPEHTKVRAFGVNLDEVNV